MTDVFEIGKTVPGESLPFCKCCHLCFCNRRPRGRLQILFAFREPPDKGRACGLAAFSQIKEDFLQDGVPFERWVAQKFG